VDALLRSSAVAVRPLAQAVEVLVIGTMVLLLPLSPVACAVLSGRWAYIKHYRRSIEKSARMLEALWRTHVITRNTQRKLTHPSLTTPQSIQGSCTHCGRCCVDRACVFLEWTDEGHSRCSIYNNWFWKMTSCGSYPVDAHSIDVYGCPSFKAVPIKIVPKQSR
jgi:hypothetical protein